jgi:hypothetical protein
MAKYLIEVPHEATKQACLHAIQTFLHTGSHFLTNADWGCKDNEHKAWFILDVKNKEQAKSIIPPAYRADAKVTLLSRFKREEIDEILREHAQ